MRRPKQLELPYSVERDFIGYLKDDVAHWKGEYAFLKGKVERLELALAAHGSAPARAYVDRTDAKPIEQVQVQTESKPSWKEFRAMWNAMTPEDQEKATRGAN